MELARDGCYPVALRLISGRAPFVGAHARETTRVEIIRGLQTSVVQPRRLLTLDPTGQSFGRAATAIWSGRGGVARDTVEFGARASAREEEPHRGRGFVNRIWSALRSGGSSSREHEPRRLPFRSAEDAPVNRAMLIGPDHAAAGSADVVAAAVLGQQGGDRPARLRTPRPERSSRATSAPDAPRAPNKLRKKRPDPPPAIEAPWFSRTATAMALAAQAGAGPAERRRDFQINTLLTSQEQGLALVDGRVDRWNPLEGRWEHAGVDRVLRLRLGADGHPYAWRVGGRLIALTPGGQTRHRLTRDTTDFTVSPAGELAQLCTRDMPSSSRSATGPAQSLLWKGQQLPLPPGALELRSLAFANDGQLYVLDMQGRAWRTSPEAQLRKPRPDAWVQVEVTGLPAGRRLEYLKSMADGSVAGLDQEGNHWPSINDHQGWVPSSGHHLPSLDELYARFPDGPLTKDNITLAGPIPGGERLRMSDRPWYVPSAWHRDYPGQSLRKRHADWWRTMGPAPSAGGLLRKEIAADWNGIQPGDALSLRTRRTVREQVGSRVDTNAAQALDVLERRLGFLNVDGTRNSGLPDTAAFRQVHAPQQAGTDANVLYRLLRQRERLYRGDSGSAEAQEVTARLRGLVEAGVFLPLQSSRKLMVVRQPGERAVLRTMKNPYGALTGKLVHDHAVLQRAAQAVDNRVRIGIGSGGDVLADTQRDVQRLCEEHAQLVDEGPNNHITRLFRQHVVDLDRVLKKGNAKALDDELRAHRKELKTASPEHAVMNPEVCRQVGTLVTANATRALDQLERAIGRVNPDGTPNAGFLRGAEHRLVSAHRSLVRSDENVLWRMYQQYLTLYQGTADAGAQAVAQRLHALLEDRIFLRPDSGRYIVLGRDRDEGLQLHIAKNKAGVLTAKMAHDLAVLKRAKDTVSRADASQVDRLCREHAASVDGGEGNRISELFRKGFVNLDRARHSLKAMDSIMRALQPGHSMYRAMVMQGALRDAEPVEAYIRKWQKMKPGESITFKFSQMFAIDMDGMGNVFRTSNRNEDGVGIGPLNLFLNLVPNVQPIPGVTYTRETNLGITKTADGVELSFGKGVDAELKVAAKLMWGAGAVGKLESLIGVLYGGFEVIPGVSVSRKSDGTVVLKVKQDDEGRVQNLLRDVFSGAVSPYDLLNVCVVAKTKRGVTKSVAGMVDAHALAAAVGILGLGQDRGKAILATLAQLSGSAKYTWGGTKEEGPGTNSDVHVSKFDPLLQGKQINVAELQYSRIEQTDNPQSSGGRINDGFENEHKIPVYIKVFIKNLWGKEATTDGFSIRRDEQGAIQGVDLVVHTVDTPVSKVLSRLKIHKARNGGNAFNEKNLPPLGALLEQMPEVREHAEIVRKAGRQVHMQLELTPAALRQVKELNQPARSDAVKDLVSRLVADPENLRVVEIKVDSTKTYKTGAFLGFNLLRLRRTAENSFQSNVAKIKVIHDDAAGTPPQAEIGGSLLLGRNERPDFAQLSRTVVADPARLRWLDDPVGGDAQRQRLVLLPRERTRDGVDLRLARETLVRRLPMPHEPSRRAHIGLESGHLVYRQPAGFAGWRTVDVPPTMHAALMAAIEDQVPGARIGDRSLVLAAMSHGETGMLGTPSLAGEHEQALRALADNRMVVAAHHRPLPDAQRLDRALHVVDILDDLRSRRLRNPDALDPAQRYVLRRFFPTEAGGLDTSLLAQVLNDPQQLKRFAAAVDAARDPARARRSRLGPLNMPTENRIATIAEAAHTDNGNQSVPTHTAI